MQLFSEQANHVIGKFLATATVTNVTYNFVVHSCDARRNGTVG